jgi:hypothetical protein
MNGMGTWKKHSHLLRQQQPLMNAEDLEARASAPKEADTELDRQEVERREDSKANYNVPRL